MSAAFVGKWFRRLRIAWSVIWVAASLAICVLWWRSYRESDVVFGKAVVPHEIVSVRGRLKITAMQQTWPTGTLHNRYPISDSASQTLENHVRHYSNSLGFGVYERHAILFPYWFLALVVALPAAVPWIRWRFSLRGMLIGVTVIGLVLGFLLWAFRGR